MLLCYITYVTILCYTVNKVVFEKNFTLLQRIASFITFRRSVSFMTVCWYVCHKRHSLQDPKLPIFHQCSRSFVLIVRKCHLQFTVNIQLCSPQDNLIFRRNICNFCQFQKLIQPDIIADTVW